MTLDSKRRFLKHFITLDVWSKALGALQHMQREILQIEPFPQLGLA